MRVRSVNLKSPFENPYRATATPHDAILLISTDPGIEGHRHEAVRRRKTKCRTRSSMACAPCLGSLQPAWRMGNRDSQRRGPAVAVECLFRKRKLNAYKHSKEKTAYNHTMFTPAFSPPHEWAVHYRNCPSLPGHATQRSF